MPDPERWTPLGGSMRDVALAVLRDGPLSRTEIARRLNLSQASLTRLTKPLLGSGLLVETTSRPDPAAGRPARPLDVVPSSHHFAGVKLAGDEVSAVLVDLRGTVLRDASTALGSSAPADVVRVLARLVREVSAGTPLTGVGIGLGGSAPDTRTVTSAPFLRWDGVPLADLVEAAVGVPTVVENDVVALTTAEHWFGAGRGRRSLAVVTIGAGVGLGLVQHDRVVTHPDAGIGLVGHVPLDPDGPACPEGHRGCAVAMLTTGSLRAGAEAALGASVGYAELLDLARAGDPSCRRLVDDAARALGRLLALVGNIAMPERVVVTGEGVALAEVAREAVDTAVTADRDPRASPLDVVTRPGDFRQWARGAGVVAVQHFVLGGR